MKHAHSQQNPEKDWGTNTLNAIQFAIWALNQEYNQITPDGYVQAVFNNTNTIVIASSVSNGAGAAMAAAELDDQNLIDGIAVSEPNVALPDNPNLRVARGTRVLVGAGRPLYDYFTYANLLQPCAALSARAAGSPGAAFVSTATATNRCASLKAKGRADHRDDRRAGGRSARPAARRMAGTPRRPCCTRRTTRSRRPRSR